jgi:hypothetical protein
VEPLASNKYDVVARLDRATQYAAAPAILVTASVYWMPACAGMTKKISSRQRP